MRQAITMLLLVGATGLLAGGCGSSSKSSTTTTTAAATTTVAAKPVTKLVYSRRMVAIGTDLTNSINSVNPSTAADAATSLV